MGYINNFRIIKKFNAIKEKIICTSSMMALHDDVMKDNHDNIVESLELLRELFESTVSRYENSIQGTIRREMSIGGSFN